MLNGTLELADGTLIRGKSIGVPSFTSGEVVFTTGMVGYPETLTDPSYRGQILVFTYPLIGSYGVAEKTYESQAIQVEGIIMSEDINNYSHHSAIKSLTMWFEEQGIPALSRIDTRALTLKLREHGVMGGKLYFHEEDQDREIVDNNMRNLPSEISVGKPIILGRGKTHIGLVDCGTKQGIIDSLLAEKIKLTILPWNWSDLDGYDGVVVGNGPGDPKMVMETVENIRSYMKYKKPLLGICLGNQIIALAAGGDTYKLSYGHRSHNQPVIDTETDKAYLTTQNHGYAVDAKKLPSGWKEWFVNLNDGTNEGIRHNKLPFMSTQFHPEGRPGPEDTKWLFKYFVNLCRKY